jgi:hypothetical protein
VVNELAELTETIRPPALKPYGDYVRSGHRGVLKKTMSGPRKSRADQLLRKF